MQRLFRNLGRIAMVAALTASVVTSWSNVYADNDDNNKKKSAEIERERSEAEDRELTGQVMEINTLKDPPEMVLATFDGLAVVRMLKKDEIARNAVRLGDHVSIVGEKISEVEFEGNSIHVDAHLGEKEKKK